MKPQRLLIVASLVIAGFAGIALAQGQPAAQPAQPPAQAQPANPPAAAPAQPAQPDVSVNVTRVEETTSWYMNPFVIGLGVLALIVLVALASRGGEPTSTTTIVKD